jgi:hypothetical protein
VRRFYPSGHTFRYAVGIKSSAYKESDYRICSRPWICVSFPSKNLYLLLSANKYNRGGIASLIRLKTIYQLNNTTDFLFISTGVISWSWVEASTGVIAGSLMTLRPLLNKWWTTITGSSGDRSGPWGKSGPKSHKLNSREPGQGVSVRIENRVKHNRSKFGNDAANEGSLYGSAENLKDNIYRQVHVTRQEEVIELDDRHLHRGV